VKEERNTVIYTGTYGTGFMVPSKMYYFLSNNKPLDRKQNCLMSRVKARGD